MIGTYDSGEKAAKAMHKLLDSGKYTDLEVKMEEVEIDEKKMFSGKGEFEVKYASSKKGPIKVSKFNTLDDAKKFLAQVKGEGMNGIISKGGKPVKEENVDEARKETPAEFLKRGGKIKKVKAGMGKEGKKRVADFKKSFKKTKAKEDGCTLSPNEDERL